jgi:hypothetical protein
MFIKSKIDGKEFNSIKDFNVYLRSVKLTQKQYFTQHDPKFCKSSGKPIEFKTIEQYLLTDFFDKNEIKKWYKANPTEAKQYTIDILKKRKEIKGLSYQMGETELRSLGLPSPKYFLQTFEDYGFFCAELGIKERYNYSLNISCRLVPESSIIIDTREQSNISFAGAKTEKIEYGDYCLASNPKLSIERKSLPDLISTLVTNFDRFEREVIRCKEDGGYLVVLCESALTDALSFDYLPHIKRYTKIKPQVVFHNIRDLCQRYENIQFAFCDGRKHMKDCIKKILTCINDVSKMDLQYLIKEKKL